MKGGFWLLLGAATLLCACNRASAPEEQAVAPPSEKDSRICISLSKEMVCALEKENELIRQAAQSRESRFLARCGIGTASLQADMESIPSITTGASRALPEVSSAELIHATENWDSILAQERALAKAYFTENSTPAVVSNPKLPSIPSAPSTQTAATTPNTFQSQNVQTTLQKPALEAVEITADPVAFVPAQPDPAKPSLPVETMAVEKGLLDRAHIDFNEAQCRWSATWNKPRLFHFGMLLKPALEENLQVGEAYSFEVSGKPATLTKTEGGELLLQCDNEEIELSATRLKNLLNYQISVDGLNLFLDRGGNLVMEATGSKALAMANSKM